MKKILFSISGIVAVAAIVVASTGALFSDTETSTGNVFTAGSIDLKVDHLKQTYNGTDCETCSLTLHSGDGGAMVTNASSNATLYPITSPFPAPLVTPTTITQQYWTTLPGASWIWATDPTTVGDAGTNGDVTYTFEQKFNWWGGAVNVNLLMNVAADNQYEIFLNGTSIATGVGSAQYTTLDSVIQAAFLAQVHPGENTLTFIVTNLVNTPAGNNTPLNNPGGLLYYLTVTRSPADCDANSAFQQACRLWTQKDLVAGDHFWTIGDVKPGDYGTNLISLHVTSNDAYTCLYTGNTRDLENGINNAESKAGDVSTPQGELSNYLNVIVWPDDGDGIHQPGETPLYNGPLDSELTSRLALSTTSTGYLGLAWCAGTQSIDTGTGVISCSGVGNQNDAQTDSFTADITAYAIQQRNNSSFDCGSLLNPPIVTNPNE